MNLEHPALVRDLVEWVARQPRTYEETMDAWRTNCPRLTIWEDAVDQGFVECFSRDGSAPSVRATKTGHVFLKKIGS